LFFDGLGVDVGAVEVEDDMKGRGSREGGHDDPQKGADSKKGGENKPDYFGFRDQAFLHLYRSMNIAMAEMADERLHNSVRCKWAHCLAQTVAALCNLIRTLKVLEADSGLKGEGLSEEFLGRLMAMSDAAPKKYKDPVYREALRRKLVRSPVWKISRRDREKPRID